MPVRPWSSPALAVAVAVAACGAPTALTDTEPAPGVSATLGHSDAAPAPIDPVPDDPSSPSSPSTPSSGPPSSAAIDGEADGGEQVADTSTSIGLPVAAGTASTAATATPSTSTEALAPIVMRLRLDRRVDDVDTEGFEAFVRAVLTDERGWRRAAFEFTFSDTDYDYTVVLAEGDEVDERCLPYDTFGRFSCQIGPVVALNADRWRTAVDGWPATLDDYRTMLVNHEVGHLLGQHHPASRCPTAGEPAPVMAQQSSGVAGCLANPWPLPWEITCARQRVEPLAPPFERNIELTCGPDGPIG
ncbi:MAG: DUF3152 domain-containing protein [Actinomycetota bacterium]